MGFLKDVRNRFFPPSNRVYLRLTDSTISEVAALKKEVAALGGQVGRLSAELRDVKAGLAPIASGVRNLERAQTERQNVLLSTLDCLMLTMSRREQGRRTILLAGWYCAGNTGDELMLRTLVEHAPAALRDDIYVLAWNGNPNFDPEALTDPGVHVIHYPANVREVDLLASCFDVLVWGGGAILDDQQYDSRPNNCNTGNLFVRLSELMIAADKRVYALGLSANDSFANEEYLRRLQRIIDGSRTFTLRDQVSYEVLQAAGIRMDKVGRCEDIAFASQALMGRDLAVPHEGTVVGYVPFDIPDMRGINVAVLDDILGLVADDPATRVTLIPFYSRSDPAYLTKLREACCNPARVEVAGYADDIAASPVLACDRLVVSRYHAALIASMASIPYVCVVPDMHRHYNNKLRYLSQLSAYEDHYVNASTWVDGQRGRDLLAQMLGEDEGPHVPEGVGEAVAAMIAEAWRDIEVE